MYIARNIHVFTFFFRFLSSIFFLFSSFLSKASQLQMSRYDGTGAEALKNGIDKIFEKEGHLLIQNYNKKIVSFTSDGASVNTGQNEGLMTRMKRDRRDWLVPIHCVNHRVEMAIKESFDELPFLAVDKLYITLINLFKNSGAIKPDVY